MKPMDPIECAYVLTTYMTRLDLAVLHVRRAPGRPTPTADRLLYETQQPARTWLQQQLSA